MHPPASPAEQMVAVSIKLRAWVIQKVGPQDAEDVMQAALLGGFQALTCHLDIRSSEAYFMGILRNRIMGVYRARMRQRGEVQVDRDTVLRDERPSASELVLADEQRALVEAAMQRLPPRWREVLTRFYLNGECRADIQRDMELSDNDFRLMKWRAKQRVIDWVNSRRMARVRSCE